MDSVPPATEGRLLVAELSTDLESHVARGSLPAELNIEGVAHLEGSPNVLQSVTPQFPNLDEVLFFYTGIGTSGYYRVFGQRCTRR